MSMNEGSKDSSEVQKFMALFGRLRQQCDTPEQLVQHAETDSSIADLCVELFFAAARLRTAQRRDKELFAAQVDPQFIADWRDYESRYESPVLVVDQFVMFGDRDSLEKPAPRLDPWAIADKDAERDAASIERAIEFADDEHDFWSEELDHPIDQVESGIAAWTKLKAETGFDLRGVLRRRALIPFVLVPRGVAAKHGGTGQPSMLTNLQHTHEAFVYGATHAALALMRSIMESVLRDHYGGVGPDLIDRIWTAQSLPPGVSAIALDRLRILANNILHLTKDELLSKMDEILIEKDIMRFLIVLRALIEGAR
jgi:hypothetical protein